LLVIGDVLPPDSPATASQMGAFFDLGTTRHRRDVEVERIAADRPARRLLSLDP